MGRAIDKIHAWTRLLVLYHSPALAHHLDRVQPGWEKPTRGLSAAENEQKKNRSDLAELEKAYGLDSMEEEAEPDDGTKARSCPGGGGIASASPSMAKAAEPRGLVPLNWICGLFSGSLPSEQGVILLDWAILNQERFAGVYLFATLLEIFAQFLLQMDGEAIRAWTEEVSEGHKDWFKSDTSSANGLWSSAKASGAACSSAELSWPSFVEGWTASAAALRRRTPAAFRQALEETEDWVCSKYTTTGGELVVLSLLQGGRGCPSCCNGLPHI